MLAGKKAARADLVKKGLIRCVKYRCIRAFTKQNRLIMVLSEITIVQFSSHDDAFLYFYMLMHL